MPRRVRFLFVLLGLVVLSTYSQQVPVPVEKSNEKVIIEGKIYFIHVVKPGQTLYGISRAYHVSEKVISAENPVLVTGLQPGQVLKIPFVRDIKQNEEVRDTEKYIYHTLVEGETLYFLSKKYNVRVDEIMSGNPELQIDDIPVGTVIKIPKQQIAPKRESFAQQPEHFKYHRVKKGETLYAIARMYKLSVRDIRKVNKGIRNQLKPGEFIRIPVISPEEQASGKPEKQGMPVTGSGTVPCDSLPGTFRYHDGQVVVMLPLFIRENAERFYIDSSEVNPETGKKIRKVIYRDANWIYPPSKTFLEFYEGVKLAAEDLSEKGATLSVAVYDTRRNPATVDSLIGAGVLDHADLIIGPVYPFNVSQVAEYARQRSIPMVSPLSRNAGFLRFNPWAIQIRPSGLAEQKVMAQYIARNYQDNIVLVHTLDSTRYHEITQIKSFLTEDVSEYTYPEDVSIKEVYLPEIISPRDTVNTLELALKKDMRNIVWVVSDRESFVSEIVSRLNSMSRNYDISLYGNSSWLYFVNIQPDYFFNLHLQVFTPRFINYKDSVQVSFLRKFRRNYYTDPDIYSLAWDGYDITWYFLSAWSLYGKQLPECIPSWHPQLTTTSYWFKRTGWFSGLMNTHFSLVRYDDHFMINHIPWTDDKRLTDPVP
ncbi:MAG: LysM peptidoglycan-binding domain-containing protein [Chlorobi bacterium]|nr:LysM peptidoglycan-binding domain-containing protein [Chlorobiota bacterium]